MVNNKILARKSPPCFNDHFVAQHLIVRLAYNLNNVQPLPQHHFLSQFPYAVKPGQSHSHGASSFKSTSS